jgi:hypothetical protein
MKPDLKNGTWGKNLEDLYVRPRSTKPIIVIGE